MQQYPGTAMKFEGVELLITLRMHKFKENYL